MIVIFERNSRPGLIALETLVRLAHAIERRAAHVTSSRAGRPRRRTAEEEETRSRDPDAPFRREPGLPQLRSQPVAERPASHTRGPLPGVQVLLQLPVEVLVRTHVEDLDNVPVGVELVGRQKLLRTDLELDDTYALQGTDLGLAGEGVGSRPLTASSTASWADRGSRRFDLANRGA